MGHPGRGEKNADGDDLADDQCGDGEDPELAAQRRFGCDRDGSQGPQS